MPTSPAPPEIAFQNHIAAYLHARHGYTPLHQAEITDPLHFIAQDHLWAFIAATQPDQLRKLADLYSTDARAEFFRALHRELEITPLWMILRHGLQVRGLQFKLYYPKPRSAHSAAAPLHALNRLALRHHFYFGPNHQEIDFVIYLNGLPIIAIELKHEANQTVHDAVAQFAARDHACKIFQHPFMYIAADTADVMAAADPRRPENFRWHNTGLTNTPLTPGEYPVEFLYREVLSPDHLLEALSFFLVRVPKQDADADKPARPAFTILPRYHQSRMVRRLADDILTHFTATGDIGRKVLINHSAGSGKTLSICWLADRLHSLYHPVNNQKLVDVIFILTDRRSLDKNIRDDIQKFTHLKDIVGLAHKSEDLPRFLSERKPIIVTTQQKFTWVLNQLENTPQLKTLRVAFLIDEAHRSQEGQMAQAIRVPFRQPDEPDRQDATEDPLDDEEETIARLIRQHDRNQLFVAFTATPAPATVSLFGDPFDTYTEAEAIAEGYIVDVAASIISYKTLYNLHCPIVPAPEEERLYPKGVISKALQNVAFQDEGLIQYKAEVMLRIFEEDVKPLINGRAKAMIVAASRVAGLRYYNIIREKLKERNADYKVLYAFSDFTHPETDQPVTEHAVNQLLPGEQIEDRFEGDDYRLMIVANKFQTGFDQPLLAGMFLDKPVIDRNAVQTVSRLNRSHESKREVIVVDFTNNADSILKAFVKYRKGTPFEPLPPDPQLVHQLYQDLLAEHLFTQPDAAQLAQILPTAADPQLQTAINQLRARFQAHFTTLDDRKAYVYLLARLVKAYYFLASFFTYPEDIRQFVTFADLVGPRLIKTGGISELMEQIRQVQVTRASVQYQGEIHNTVGTLKIRPHGGRTGAAAPTARASITDVVDNIRAKYPITDAEALFIRQVIDLKREDPQVRHIVQTHTDDIYYLEETYRHQVTEDIRTTYTTAGRYEDLIDPKYTDTGGIFDLMAVAIIETHLAEA